MFGSVLVAVDGTPTSNRGLAAAIGLAKEQAATLHILNVVDEVPMAPMFGENPLGSAEAYAVIAGRLRESGRKIVASAEKTAAKSVPNVRAESIASRPGEGVAAAILRYAKRVRADVIVLGTHGRRGLSRLLMGSDAEAVLREATVPVLLVRSPGEKRTRPRKSQAGGGRQPR